MIVLQRRTVLVLLQVVLEEVRQDADALLWTAVTNRDVGIAHDVAAHKAGGQLLCRRLIRVAIGSGSEGNDCNEQGSQYKASNC